MDKNIFFGTSKYNPQPKCLDLNRQMLRVYDWIIIVIIMFLA